MRRVPLLAVSACLALGGCRPPDEPSPSVTPLPAPASAPSPSGPEIATVKFRGKHYTVCHVDLTRHHLELFWRDDEGEPFNSFSRLDEWLRARDKRLTFAMNAGMFREDYSPVGLYVEHGEELRPLNRARGDGSNFCLLPNGVFALTDSGAVVVETSEYPALADTVTLATQSGPLLVIDGKLHPKFGANSPSVNIRNGVGVVSPEHVVFALSEDPVNFHEFATLFRDELHCENALYLDGAISSLYSSTLNRNDSPSLLGPILGVSEGL